MRKDTNKYFINFILLYAFVSAIYITVFYTYLKFDLGLDSQEIQLFFIKFLWLIVVVTLVIVFSLFSLLSKVVTPYKEISLLIQRIFERSFSKSMFHLKNEMNNSYLAGAMNQLAENIERQLEIIEENDIRLHGILENMNSGILLIAKDRKIVMVNPSAEELLQYKKNELIGKRHVEATRHSEMSEMIEECFKTREKVRKELTLYYPIERILRANFIPMKNEHNEIFGVVVILNDLTDVKKLEKMKSDFVANVSHELKTPITSIKGFTETLLDGAYQEEETSVNFLNIIKHESDRLLQIVNDLLDLSKIEHGKDSLMLEDFHLKNLVELLFLTLDTKIVNKELNVDIKIDDTMTMVGDKSKISQVLINLINNAIVYTPKKGTITIGGDVIENYYRIYVQDTGIGIAKENLQRIFERFYRVDKSRSRENGGTGLGLAIVKHIVDSHNGKIEVESSINKGTTFTIFLPKVR